MEFLYRSYLNITIGEYIIYGLFGCFIFYNLRGFFDGRHCFSITLFLCLACLVGQMVTGIPLQFRIIQWFDELPFLFTWFPLSLTTFFTVLFYSKGTFRESVQISVVLSSLIVLVIALIF